MRDTLKAAARAVALVFALPSLVSFALRAPLVGRDRALESSSQALALLPGLFGQYVRRAFLARTLERCADSAVIAFGTVCSKTAARLDENVYVGPSCHLGMVHIERDVLVASGVQITSGARTHGTDDASAPIREQTGTLRRVTIGQGAWIGAGAIVMADVGRNAVIGAGAVVTTAIPEGVVAAGVPARVVRERSP